MLSPTNPLDFEKKEKKLKKKSTYTLPPHKITLIVRSGV